MHPISKLLFSVVTAVIAGMTASPALAYQLRAELTAVDQEGAARSAGELLVNFTLTNDTTSSLYILRYQTPFDGFERSLFRVERDGAPVTYIGKMVTRLAPVADDWIRLEPGEAMSAVIDLSEAYDTSLTGTYTATYRATHDVVRADRTGALRRGLAAASMPEMVESEGVLAAVQGVCDDAACAAEVRQLDQLIGARGFTGCTTSQQSTLASAQSGGRSQASSARSRISSDRPFYTRWFGTYSSSYYNRASATLGNSAAALGSNINYTCTSCSGGVIAYVYPSRPYYIWICPGFFGMATTERASVIVHEATHWTNVGSTQDYTYGYSQCLSLAARSPRQAIYNADNYRFACLQR